jgi:hypothetical protein
MATSTNDLLARMADMQNEEVDLLHRIMLYGPPGGGKTILAMMCAQSLKTEGGKILYIDSKDGWVSLLDWPKLQVDVKRIQYKGYSDLPALASNIAKRVKGFENFETVVIDEESSIADQVLDTIVRERLGTLPGDIPRENPDWTDYRPMGALIVKAVEAFMDAGVHVILISHSKTETDARKVIKTMPSDSAKLAGALQKLMHVTGYVSAEVKGTAAEPVYIRTVQSQQTGLVAAKTRIGALRKGVKLDFMDFVEAIVGWGTSGAMQTEIGATDAEAEALLAEPDEIPTDGLPLVDNPDDEPAFVEEN